MECRGMNDDMQAGMAEATRLTLAGRLAEATAAIQRALGTVAAPDVDAAGAGGVAGDSAPAMQVPGSDTLYKTGTLKEGGGRKTDGGRSAAPASAFRLPPTAFSPAGRPRAPGRA